MSPPQPARAITRLSKSERVRQLGLDLKSVIALDKGEPSFDTPAYIVEAAEEALEQGYTHYPPAKGDPDLRERVAEMLSRSGGTPFSPDDVFITNGASAAIFATMAAYLNPEDTVLIHDPAYSLYADVASALDVDPIRVPWADSFRLDLDALVRAASHNAKMLILNTPCNPTGIVLSSDEIAEVAEVVLKHDLILVVDEAYDRIIFDGQLSASPSSIQDLDDRTVTINTFSKTYAMTGWRVGYLAGHGRLVRPPSLIHRTAAGHVNWVAQRAALAALSGSTDWERTMLAEYAERRAIACSLLNAIDGLHCDWPEGTFYAFVRVDLPTDGRGFAERCLQHGVAVRGGLEFGSRGSQYVRVSFAAEGAQIREGLARMHAAAASFGE